MIDDDTQGRVPVTKSTKRSDKRFGEPKFARVQRGNAQPLRGRVVWDARFQILSFMKQLNAGSHAAFGIEYQSSVALVFRDPAVGRVDSPAVPCVV